MRKSLEVRVNEDIVQVKPTETPAQLTRAETPLQHWSRLHLEFLLAEHFKAMNP